MTHIVAAAHAIVDHIRSQWNYQAHFSPPHQSADEEDAFVAANKIQEDAHIERHPYFVRALGDRSALRLWAGQEAVVTGAFSQMLLLTASRLENVHLRAAFLDVVVGEHNARKNGLAIHSHPWLLHRLCKSMGLSASDITPLPPTVKFLEALASTTSNTMLALGAFGVGNERMLIPEYGAVKYCFERCYAEAEYRGFLLANITEDAEHTRIIEDVARCLAFEGKSVADYLAGAHVGVAARVDYYDDLYSYQYKDLP